MGSIAADTTSGNKSTSEHNIQTMTESRVPMTLRDFFFDDPFFKSTWEDFDVLRDNMLRESRDMWKRFEQEFNQMDSSMSSNMIRSSNKQMMESSSTSDSKRMESNSMIDRKTSTMDKTMVEAKDRDDIFNQDRKVVGC